LGENTDTGLSEKKQEADEIKTSPPPSSPRETTYFGKNLKIKGNVSGSGDIIHLGLLEGEFDLKGTLQVAEPARINGIVKANDIVVKGDIQGTITAAKRVHLDSTARVQGRISSPKISMAEGACLEGDINMGGKAPQPASSSAPAAVSDSEKKKISEKK
jgi:cytoskeletal protein CcmA (bactofilin family)